MHLQSPTQSDTYGHTLSLHAALPICTWSATTPVVVRVGDSSGSDGSRSREVSAFAGRPRVGLSAPAGAACPACLPIPSRQRSEEHTSELQSLMRISYAVFCLKNKTNNNTHSTDYHDNKRRMLT